MRRKDKKDNRFKARFKHLIVFSQNLFDKAEGLYLIATNSGLETEFTRPGRFVYKSFMMCCCIELSERFHILVRLRKSSSHKLVTC